MAIVMLVFDPLQRLAHRYGERPHEIVVGIFQRTLVAIMHITGMRLEVERSPLVEPHTGYVIVSNHQGMFDIPIFGGLLFTNYPKYIAKHTLAKWIPSVSYNLRNGGNVLIDRDQGSEAVRAIRDMGRRVQERGVSAVIFPEGTRSVDGELLPFKEAGAATLIKAASSLSIVPVAVDGSWEFVSRSMRPIPFGTRLKVYFGEPIERHKGEDPTELLARAEMTIRATLERWRSGGGASL
jgi:1-acyl-sn-glycerol-3-phosphate acyltransferase